MTNIETTKGTFTAEPWHIGKMVAADPSGFNWRIIDDDVDRAIAGLERGGEMVFHGLRMLVTMSVLPDKVIIHASDTAIEHEGCTAVLTNEGKRQFWDVLMQVKDEPDIAYLMEQHERRRAERNTQPTTRHHATREGDNVYVPGVGWCKPKEQPHD